MTIFPTTTHDALAWIAENIVAVTEAGYAAGALSEVLFSRFTASHAQTVFSGPDLSGRPLQVPGATAQVYVNLKRMIQGSQYVIEANGTRLRFLGPLQGGSEVLVSNFAFAADGSIYFDERHSPAALIALTDEVTAAADNLSGLVQQATSAATTAAQDAAAAVAPAVAEAVRTQVATEADRAEAAASRYEEVPAPASGQLVDTDAKRFLVVDMAGGLHLPGLRGRSVQDVVGGQARTLVDLSGAAAAAAPAAAAIADVTAPALRRSTDAQHRVHDVVDMMGGLHLPGLAGKSVQDHVRALHEKLSDHAKLIAYSTVIDAVRDLGCDPHGRTACDALINAALLKLSAATTGPATIFFPRGNYRLANEIVPQTGVSMVGESRDAVTFLPFARKAAFQRVGQVYLERAMFVNFGIDGANQPATGGYSVGIKGMFFQGFRLCVFHHLRVMNTGATGLGIDFADASLITENIVDNCGRLAVFGDYGASGIGIGTGRMQDEPLIISDNMCRDNTNYGIFLERQGADEVLFDARHNVIADNISARNGYGIGECGCDGTIISGNQVTDNTSAGVVLHRGTVAASHAGQMTQITGNHIARNGGDGVKFDVSANLPAPRGYSSDGNRIEANGGAGHHYASANASWTDDLAIRGDEIIGNGGPGIAWDSGTLSNADIIAPRIINNTGPAIRIDAGVRGGRIWGATMRDIRQTPTQTTSITGAGNLTDFDVAECQYVGPASPMSLTGTQTRVTTGRNQGL